MRSGCVTGRSIWLAAGPFCTLIVAAGLLAAAEPALVVVPERIELEGNFARVQILALRPKADGAPDERSEDLTTQATYESSDVGVATVSGSGQVLAVGNGEAKITVAAGDGRKEVPVVVRGIATEPEIGFSESIRPILNKAGCAMAACHASQHGKGGFKLSVFGYDPDKDREAMVRDGISRRADFVEPERSLLLLKPTMQTPHGGGKRLEKGSVDYQILLAWIAAGGPGPRKTDP
jgi:Big-like domain-containing protein